MKHPFFMVLAPDGDGGSGGGSSGGGQGGGSGDRSLIGDAGKSGGGSGGGSGGQGGDGKGGAQGDAIAPSWWKGWIKEDGSLDPQRLSHLPEDLKGSQAILARFRKADDFFKSFAHAQHLLTQKGLMPLRPDATPEERAEHMKRLAQVNGVPEKPEGYGLKVDNNPELQKQLDAFAQVFHKWALPPDAVKELHALNERINQEALEAFETEQARAADTAWQEQEKALAREFGPFKAEKIKAAVAGARWSGIDPDSPLFKQNAALIIAMAKVGEKIGEAQFVNGDASDHVDGDPEAEMARLTSDATHKYYDILRNPGKNPRLAQEAYAYQRKLGEKIAAKRARLASAAR